MKILPLMLFFSIKTSFANDFLTQVQKINQTIGQNKLETYLSNPKSEGVQGPYFESLLPGQKFDSQEQCMEEVEPESTTYEIVAIGSTEQSEVEVLPGQKVQFKTLDLQSLVIDVPTSAEGQNLDTKSVTKRAKELWDSGRFTPPSKDFDLKHPIGKELFIEGLVQAAAKSNLNEKDLSKTMAHIIRDTYKSDEERYQAISAYSLRLYRNYNTARNPQYNNIKNNPFNVPLPEGDLTANQLVSAAARFSVFEGGVCNDVSEAVAMVGEHLFPEKDVLTVNSGSHFGVVVTDGKNHRIIDGGDEFKATNKLFLVPEMSPTNLRINQVKNGALREIAVVDTELGQLTEAAFRTGKKLLKTDADVSSVIFHLKKGNFGVSLGSGRLSDSNVVIVVAQYKKSGDKLSGHVGVGTTAQKYDNGLATKYQLHLKTGAEAKLFHYVNKNTDVKVSTGIQGEYTYTINPHDWGPGKYKIDMSTAVSLVNKVEVSHGMANPNGVQVKGNLQTEHAFGPTNWGNTTGALSYLEPSDIKPLLKNVSFHLNQVNADVEVSKKLSTKATGSISGAYQGSNIGQKVSVLAGIEVTAPKGAKILFFTGYSNPKLKGYLTQHSLLSGVKGAEGGIKLTTKKGIEFETKVQRSISGKPSVKATLSVPISNSSGR